MEGVLALELHLSNCFQNKVISEEDSHEFTAILKELFHFVKSCTNGQTRNDLFQCISHIILMKEQPFVIPIGTKITQIRDIGNKNKIEEVSNFALKLWCQEPGQ